MALTITDIRRAPKALLHDHLDGGLRPETILQLADECGWTPHLPSTDPAALGAWFTRGAETKDLLQYLATFEHTNAVMQTESGLERVAFEAAMDLAADGVIYAEVRYAPELHTSGGLALDAVVDAVQAGFERGMETAVAAGTPISVNTIICAIRTEQRSVEMVHLTLRARDRHARVVAFDLAGAETGWSPLLHAEALAIARAHQLHLTIHASEPPDVELIADALACGAQRIGHGVRLTADIDADTGALGPVARFVLESQTALELAPTCNVQIGAVPQLADHPIDQFRRLGMRVTVNTDNRLMSDVSVSGEILACADAFGWGWAEVEQVTLNALESSFGSWSERRRLADEVVKPAYAALASLTAGG